MDICQQSSAQIFWREIFDITEGPDKTEDRPIDHTAWLMISGGKWHP